jgi:hypothetical protein
MCAASHLLLLEVLLVQVLVVLLLHLLLVVKLQLCMLRSKPLLLLVVLLVHPELLLRMHLVASSSSGSSICSTVHGPCVTAVSQKTGQTSRDAGCRYSRSLNRLLLEGRC